jgi:epsin
MSHIWSRLELEKEEWRKIYKALYLIDMVIKCGDTTCIDEIKGKSYDIRKFETFSYKTVGVEKGNGIREKAKAIGDLLSSSDLIREERLKIKKIRQKLTGQPLHGI